MARAIPPFKGNQLEAISPDRQVRLSASAGTGKTQVLSARVLRLLLNGADPESILCLTFTKAGAAEMQERIHEKLSEWVTAPEANLYRDLENLGTKAGPEARDGARNLLARVLDARGSGLRIQTIHSFCQSLLAGFPAEAGLTPGFRPVEGREEEALAAKALSDMVEEAGRGGELGLIDRLRALSLRLGEDRVRGFLRRAAAAPDAMTALGIGIEAKVRHWLNLPDVDPDELLLAACTDGGFDRFGLERIRQLNLDWGTGRGMEKVEAITDWLAMPVAARFEHIDVLLSVWTTAAGDKKSFAKGHVPPDDAYPPLVDAQYDHFNGLIELRRLIHTSAAIADALTVGQAYARTYSDAKRAAGVVDFNDLIRHTVELLRVPGIGDWIKFKLDQQVEHILVDEAQDTNAEQWEIVRAIADEFFSGSGSKGEKLRTLFMVGDHKQAIFGFQGTDPEKFNLAAAHFKRLAEAAEQGWHDLPLNQSFRSSQPILDVTDAVIAELGYEAMGLEEEPRPHVSAPGGSGRVHLLPPVNSAAEDIGEELEAEEGWIADSELKWADQLAAMVKHWTSGGLRLRNKDRDAQPGDVMILLSKRGELARLIVSRLYQAGVPVAGVDRLRLGAPIVVQDLLACIRFVLQPDDDLSLACLLVSPLIGWDQEKLYDHAKGRGGLSLWQHLGEAKPEELSRMLKMADLTTPYRLLESILSGPIAGRKKLIARLGEEARDPIEELLNAALAFEQQEAPSLQLFLDWFDRGEVDIKRDPSKPENAVRVMTAHGAKGLQAPIVVLADATTDPKFKRADMMDWEVEEGLTFPLFRPAKADLAGSLAASAERQDAREDQEHWRLLYVALTRAEEHLVIGGALSPKQQKNGPSEHTWHAHIWNAMTAMEAQSDNAGGLIVDRPEPPKAEASKAEDMVLWTGEFPAWALRPAAQESRPPRPLAPSALGVDDDEASPPPDPAMRAAALRGIRLHSLFERLPSVPPVEREESALRWLEHSAGVDDADVRAELVKSALTVIEDQRFAAIFSPDALAEVPLAGVVDGQVIAGTVDRLLVSDTEILVVDFKTGRRVPRNTDAVSRHHKAQMAAYAAVLAGIFPGKAIRAALLYSSGPSLIELSPATLEAHKPGFSNPQHNLAEAG